MYVYVWLISVADLERIVFPEKGCIECVVTDDASMAKRLGFRILREPKRSAAEVVPSFGGLVRLALFNERFIQCSGKPLFDRERAMREEVPKSSWVPCTPESDGVWFGTVVRLWFPLECSLPNLDYSTLFVRKLVEMKYGKGVKSEGVAQEYKLYQTYDIDWLFQGDAVLSCQESLDF